MHRILLLLVAAPLWAPLCFCLDTPAGGEQIVLLSPLDYQVFQRISLAAGDLRVHGTVTVDCDAVQIRVTGKSRAGELNGGWLGLTFDKQKKEFSGTFSTPAGGWYRVELQALSGEKPIARRTVEHVGVGEVFVIAGQSNSTNYGAEKQKPACGRVATFDGKTWRIADDPQPGTQDGSSGGSFVPAFGDALFEKLQVPIGVASTGAGATSVRQWLMKGEKIEQLPTLTAHVKVTGPNQGEATGTLFDGLMKRIAALGTHGFRALLWHQGESDAGQAREGYPAERQISGESYRELLEKIIRASQEQAGWKFPWFVAQATYHKPQDASDPEFRAAQKALWDSGLAQEGPDTDTLTGDNRSGVHFSGKGQHAHGQLWAEKVGAYLDKVLAQP